ncbi:LPXTG-site transpeptidase (sortase) family protein [Amycolatopsis sacchari]|uniref:LPXTG-site transpeptidase (Sortase) family protein n=1 Tax=Amycolatopsis sacchari TaxID=115433 RepID=A0A1I3ZBX4_9PSEU|nr:class F sortase [Amycolatopsis sacchari]SFK41086.1 LPXTG-site transpeptidase (sortase) family protein [Amycolatopsis sacchari]
MRNAVLSLLAVLGLLLAGCTGTGSAGAGTTPPAENAGGPVTVAVADPSAVDIPKIGAHSSLVPLGVNADGTVQVPPVETPQQAGWYHEGPPPGDVGPAVILGHVDGKGQKGVFYRLHELKPGDEVTVSRVDGSVARFSVTRVDQVDKDQFPTEAVYGDTSDPELRLITCGGSFDHAAHSYRDNIIVYAKLS